MNDTTTTPYRCRAATRCADRERITVTPRVCDACTCHNGPYQPCSVEGGCGHLHTERTELAGAPITTFDGLCPMCTVHTGHDIIALKGDVAELSMLIGRTGTASGDKITATPEPPTPLRLSVEALRASIDHELGIWAEAVAERLGIDWPTTAQLHATRMGPRVTRAADLLANTVDTLVALPPLELPAWRDGEPAWDTDLDVQDTEQRDGIDAALRFSHLHRLAYNAAGRTRLVHHLLPRCEHCGQRTLIRHDGEEDARCESDRCRGRVVPAGRINWLVMATTAVEQAVRRHEQGAA